MVLPVAWLAGAAGLQVLHGLDNVSMEHVWRPQLHLVSLLLMGLAGTVALAVATVATCAFTRLGRLTVTWAAAGVLVVPPLVYGYLWFAALGDWVTLRSLPVPIPLPAEPGNLLLSSWTIGLWLWPVAAVLLTIGWQWAGRPAWLLARLDAGDGRAFLRAALPAMRPYVVAAGAVCMVLAAQEYAVPALFSVQTWQTQWLVQAQSGTPLGVLAVAAMPPAALLLTLLAVAARMWRGTESLGPADLGTVLRSRGPWLRAWLVLAGVLGATALVPAIGAVHTLEHGLRISLRRFEAEMVSTPMVAGAAATLALAGALAAMQTRRLRRAWLGVALAAWVLPMALLAEAARRIQAWSMDGLDAAGRMVPPLAAALDRIDLFETLNLIMWVSVLAGRMVPIAWITLTIVRQSLPANLAEQAAVDGAGRWKTLQSILLPLLAPAAAGAWLLCGLLAATDTAAATMLQPPGFGVLATSLLNQMHYGRDADVVATCLLMMAAAAGAAGLVAMGLGRTGGDRGLH